jgi:hypothetical protein
MVALRKWIRLVRGRDVKPLSLWILWRVFIHTVDGSRKVVGFGDTTCPGFVDLLLPKLRDARRQPQGAHLRKVLL